MLTTFFKQIGLFLLCFVAIPVSAQSVDLLWQANTYTPPFYKGKALYSPQSSVTLVAIPHIFTKAGTEVADKDLVFNWKQDFVVLGSLSGLGKNSFTFKGAALPKPTTIEVEIFSPSEHQTVSKSFEFSARSPEVYVYEDNPLYGVLYNKAASSPYTLREKEVKLTAEPYFFSTDSTATKNLSYSWNVRGSDAASSDQKSIIVRHEGTSVGDSDIFVSVGNTRDYFQKVDTGLRIHFDSTLETKTISF